MADVVLAYDNLEGLYPWQPPTARVIGRSPTASGGAQFTVEGKTYHLKANAGPTTSMAAGGLFLSRLIARRP